MTAIIVILFIVAIGTGLFAAYLDWRDGGFDAPVWDDE